MSHTPVYGISGRRNITSARGPARGPTNQQTFHGTPTNRIYCFVAAVVWIVLRGWNATCMLYCMLYCTLYCSFIVSCIACCVVCCIVCCVVATYCVAVSIGDGSRGGERPPDEGGHAGAQLCRGKGSSHHAGQASKRRHHWWYDPSHGSRGAAELSKNFLSSWHEEISKSHHYHHHHHHHHHHRPKHDFEGIRSRNPTNISTR